MAFDAGNLKEIFKDKRVLIGAAVIGGVAGLYVLSKSGGAGGGALQPSTPLDPTAPANSDGGGSDTAGLQGQIAELTSGQSGLQALISNLQDTFAAALGNAQSQNQSALQSVIDQVNGQLSSGQYQQAQTVPDFSGFLSQLTAGASYLPQQVTNPTGTIFKNAIPLSKVNQIGKSSQNILSQVTAPTTHFQTQVSGQTSQAKNTLNQLKAALKFTSRRPPPVNSQSWSVINRYASGAGSKVAKSRPSIKPPKKLYSGGSGLLKG